MCKALSFLEALTTDFEPSPIPMAFTPIAHRLAELGYTSLAISSALTDIRRFGSAWASEWVDFEDLAEIEAMVPGVSPWQWGAAGDDVYGLGTEA
jgi:hypothetical protein